MTCREKILSENYQDFVSYYLFPETPEQNRENDAYCVIPITDELWSVYVKRAFLPELSFSDYNYRYVTELYGLMDEFISEAADQRFDPQPLMHSGILTVQREPLALTGRNVVIGFADTGIDYRNPVFRRSDGSSRILAVWDQTVQSGMPPEGYEYGSLYTREQIDAALALEDPLDAVPVTDEIGHGTRMASAAAGNELQNGLDFVGAAPDADLVVVKLKPAKQFLRDFFLLPKETPAYELNDILLAIKFLNSFIEPYRRPGVLCIGVGRSFGGHQGQTILEQYLSGISRDINRIAVIAGGNEGNTAHHFAGYNVDGSESSAVGSAFSSRDSAFGNAISSRTSAAGSVNAELRVGENVPGILMEIWANIPGYFTLEILSPSGEVIPAINSRLRGSWEYRFVYGRTRMRLDYQQNDQLTGSAVAVLRLEEPTAGIWTLRLSQDGAGQGEFQIWLPIRQFVEGEAEFLQPEVRSTLTAPSYSSASLAVSAYDSRNDSFSITSGQGFGLGGRNKPELAVPGVEISAATGMLRGRTVVGKVTGSSMAAALAAGACAQLLEWAVTDGNYREINGIGIKSYLVRGAVQNPGFTYPSPLWGYGQLNLEGTFDWIAGA